MVDLSVLEDTCIYTIDLEGVLMAVEEKQNPLGYKGKISTLVRKMAIPAIVAKCGRALYNIVDQIFIGQGVGCDAATNIAFQLRHFVWPLG